MTCRRCGLCDVLCLAGLMVRSLVGLDNVLEGFLGAEGNQGPLRKNVWPGQRHKILATDVQY